MSPAIAVSHSRVPSLELGSASFSRSLDGRKHKYTVSDGLQAVIGLTCIANDLADLIPFPPLKAITALLIGIFTSIQVRASCYSYYDNFN
jgi:hypothetical protein